MTPHGEHHGPIRTCVGCRERRPARDLVRCVLGADGVVRADRHGAGRGAWLCGPDCLDAAVRRRGFDRAFRRPIAPVQLERLRDELIGRDDAGAHVPGDTTTTSGGGDRPRHCETTTTTKG